jgi:hypothetical protein
MTDEGEPSVADLTADIVSADRPSAPTKDGMGNRSHADHLIRAWLVFTVLAFLLAPLIVVILTRPQ